MSASERDEKFMDCAGGVLGDVGAKRALDLAIAARSIGNIAELVRATVPAQDAARVEGKSASAVTAK
jgi:hypothetical protein